MALPTQEGPAACSSAAAVKQLATVGFMSEPRDAAELIAQLDRAGIERGVVLSTAYWFGAGVMAPPAERRRV